MRLREVREMVGNEAKWGGLGMRLWKRLNGSGL